MADSVPIHEPASLTVSTNLTPDSLLRLPNEMFVLIGDFLEVKDLARFMQTSKLFYGLLVGPLYQKAEDNKGIPAGTRIMDLDMDNEECVCISEALRWGVKTGSVSTMQRALRALRVDFNPSLPSSRCAYFTALHDAHHKTTLAFQTLLDHGAPVNVPPVRRATSSSRCTTFNPDDRDALPVTFWPILLNILVTPAVTWCPVAVLREFFARGATLVVDGYGEDASLAPGFYDIVTGVWKFLLHPHVPSYSYLGSEAYLLDLPKHIRKLDRNEQLRIVYCAKTDECASVHDVESCHSEMLRLLLRQDGVSPNVYFDDGRSLVQMAMDHQHFPLDLVEPLVDAGADLEVLCTGPDPTVLAVLRDAIRQCYGVSRPRANPNRRRYVHVLDDDESDDNAVVNENGQRVVYYYVDSDSDSDGDDDNDSDEDDAPFEYKHSQAMMHYLLSKGVPFDIADVNLTYDKRLEALPKLEFVKTTADGQTVHFKYSYDDLFATHDWYTRRVPNPAIPERDRPRDDHIFWLLNVWHSDWFKSCRGFASYESTQKQPEGSGRQPSWSTRRVKRRKSI